MFLVSSCGNKEETSGCVQQEAKNIYVSCVVKKGQNTTDCTGAGPSSALCQLGFNNGCVPSKIDPQVTKIYIEGTATVPESQRLKLTNIQNGKELVFKEITDSFGTYIILQHFDDAGDTSSVNLPVCTY